MDASYHRHDISDEVWALLEPHLPGQRVQWGGITQETGALSMRCFWYYVPAPLGATFLQIMGNGVLYISGLSVGAGKAFGKSCRRF